MGVGRARESLVGVEDVLVWSGSAIGHSPLLSIISVSVSLSLSLFLSLLTLLTLLPQTTTDFLILTLSLSRSLSHALYVLHSPLPAVSPSANANTQFATSRKKKKYGRSKGTYLPGGLIPQHQARPVLDHPRQNLRLFLVCQRAPVCPLPRSWNNKWWVGRQVLTVGTPSGGEEVLLDVGGQEATEAFEDVGHSDEARELLDGMFVGNLKRMVCFPPPSPSSPFPYVSSVSLPLVYKISLRPLHQQLSRKKKKRKEKKRNKC